ncbi:hypothetical protein WJX84_006868 [Apatococcus fuscideae]|uniref:C3H1-type domain-containing protein n=1 Tax=Apatococcus fuscideae TaxID=2026836 RepID=A0AAW1TDE6_9CHLO
MFTACSNGSNSPENGSSSHRHKNLTSSELEGLGNGATTLKPTAEPSGPVLPWAEQPSSSPSLLHRPLESHRQTSPFICPFQQAIKPKAQSQATGSTSLAQPLSQQSPWPQADLPGALHRAGAGDEHRPKPQPSNLALQTPTRTSTSTPIAPDTARLQRAPDSLEAAVAGMHTGVGAPPSCGGSSADDAQPAMPSHAAGPGNPAWGDPPPAETTPAPGVHPKFADPPQLTRSPQHAGPMAELLAAATHHLPSSSKLAQLQPPASLQQDPSSTVQEGAQMHSPIPASPSALNPCPARAVEQHGRQHRPVLNQILAGLPVPKHPSRDLLCPRENTHTRIVDHGSVLPFGPPASELDDPDAPHQAARKGSDDPVLACASHADHVLGPLAGSGPCRSIGPSRPQEPLPGSSYQQGQARGRSWLAQLGLREPLAGSLMERPTSIQQHGMLQTSQELSAPSRTQICHPVPNTDASRGRQALQEDPQADWVEQGVDPNRTWMQKVDERLGQQGQMLSAVHRDLPTILQASHRHANAQESAMQQLQTSLQAMSGSAAMHLRSEPEPVQHPMEAQTAAALQGMSDRLTLLEAHLGETSGLTTDQQLRDMRQQLHALRHLPEAASLIMHSIDTVLIPVVGSLKAARTPQAAPIGPSQDIPHTPQAAVLTSPDHLQSPSRASQGHATRTPAPRLRPTRILQPTAVIAPDFTPPEFLLASGGSRWGLQASRDQDCNRIWLASWRVALLGHHPRSCHHSMTLDRVDKRGRSQSLSHSYKRRHDASRASNLSRRSTDQEPRSKRSMSSRQASDGLSASLEGTRQSARRHSSPSRKNVDQSASKGRAQAIGNGKVLPMDPRWKTALCWDWERDGRCSYANCSYAHGKQDLRGGMMADFRAPSRTRMTDPRVAGVFAWSDDSMEADMTAHATAFAAGFGGAQQAIVRRDARQKPYVILTFRSATQAAAAIAQRALEPLNGWQPKILPWTGNLPPLTPEQR